MNCLKHSVFLADVCAAGSADAAHEFGSLVGDYITVEVRKNEYLEILAALGIDELCGSDVDIPFVGRDFGIFLADILGEIEKFAVGCLYDICLLNN